MNRRKFLQYTIALAAVAPFAKLLPELPADPLQWVPTQFEVDEWLTYYKICVQQGVTKFADIVGTVLSGRPEHEQPGLGTRWASTPEEAEAEHQLLLEAERAFYAMELDRRAVAWSQGEGYSAGRDGLPRFCERYTGPSNEGFGWYNMWSVGNFDRRWKAGEVSLPRSPGVTWPDGRRPPTSWDRYLERKI